MGWERLHDRRLDRRRPASSVATVVLVFVAGWAAPLWADSPVLHAVVEGDLTCPTREALWRAMAARLGREPVTVGTPGQGALLLLLRVPAPGQLQIELSARTGQRFKRLLRASPKECSELADTVAYLIDEWLQELPWRSETILPPRAPEQRAPPGAAPQPDAVEAAPSSPAPPPSTADQSADSASTPPPEQRADPNPTSPPDPVAPVPPTPGWAVLGVLQAGAILDAASGRGALRMGAVVEGGGGALGRFGLGLQLTIDGPLQARTGPGKVSLTTGALSLLGRFELVALDARALDVLLGVGVERLAADSQGYAQTLPRAGFGSMSSAALRWRQSLFAGLGGVAEAGVRVRATSYDLVVEGVGPVLQVSPVQLFATLGLSWNVL